ncbi:MAG: exodeoxyribonuclease VII large subunit [Bauldia sp.]
MNESASNIAEYTVSEIASAVKRTVEDTFGYVRVRGEISGFKGPHSSGHAYFALKDEKARLEAVIWRQSFNNLRFKPQEGLEVVATGRLTTFPGTSKYQIVIDTLEPAGIGALMALLEERRKKLAAEGLFDAARKKKLPYAPRVIGVVTSPTGAVIRDILHRLRDRFPVHVLLWPVRVQGETAAAEVAVAIAGFNALTGSKALPRPEVLIVARGGGSLEDLWAFNEEVVVRAAAASRIPLISAIGHETDWTLLDHVADLRAPTPTAAAELAVPVRSELLANLDGAARRLSGGIARTLDAGRRDLRSAARLLPSPDDLLGIPRRRLDEAAARLGRSLQANTLAHRAMLQRAVAGLSVASLRRGVERLRERAAAASGRLDTALAAHAERKRAALTLQTRRLRLEPIAERARQARLRVGETGDRMRRAIDLSLDKAWDRLESLEKLLAAYSFSKENVLARGYALVSGPDGTPLRSAAEARSGMALDIEFADGRVAAIAQSSAATPKPRPRRRRVPGEGGGQGQLF